MTGVVAGQLTAEMPAGSRPATTRKPPSTALSAGRRPDHRGV